MRLALLAEAEAELEGGATWYDAARLREAFDAKSVAV